MKKIISVFLIVIASVNVLALTYYVLSSRTHWTFSEDTSGLNCVCGGFVGSYEERASFYSISEKERNSFWFVSVMVSILAITYVIITNFGKVAKKPLLLESLDKENEIIRKQIEKRELLAKLENLEKK